MEKELLKDLLMLQSQLDGDLYVDDVCRLLHATDASAYREKPLAVVRPGNSNDIRTILGFAVNRRIPVITRAAGTSLAGQVVGAGIILDISRYMTRILELNVKESWVRVEPGVILDELNAFLAGHGLFFGPETSTSNRCMLGGMLGNNACGSHSLVYGSTRDHILEVTALLADGSEVRFGPLSPGEFDSKCRGSDPEARLYRQIRDSLSDPGVQEEIPKQYPHPSVHRRNSGYALDVLLNTEVFNRGKEKFNFSKLIAGSEGTLAVATSLKLRLVPLPPAFSGLLCAHFLSLEEAFRANLVALKHGPVAVEMMDKTILKLAGENTDQQRNSFFVSGSPAAILIIEFRGESMAEIEERSATLEDALRKEGLGYHYPLVTGTDTGRVWNLRKAGLGVLSNMKGDAKPVSLIEDTAVPVEVLPEYMAELRHIFDRHGLDCVFHAHIGSGELHLRPVLNLKDAADNQLFRELGREAALLVKKYGGSLSGEHGDGRLRGEFLPLFYGERIYDEFRKLKNTWDPWNILNPGKITDTPPMNSSLRYTPGSITPEFDTWFDFSNDGGFARAIEKCNGSGDCRKTEKAGGTMCPSYMAARDEYNTTRARANLLRELIVNSGKKDPFSQEELYRILDLCLSCKGCKTECPSNIDMAKFKAEFLQHYHDRKGLPLRTRLIAHITAVHKIGSLFPALFNFLTAQSLLSGSVKRILGFAGDRDFPPLHRITLRKWIRQQPGQVRNRKGELYLFVDEFTNFLDTPTGITAIKLLNRLGYQVHFARHRDSGRSFISKGLLRRARKLADANIRIFSPLISENIPLVGIEPSAILSFRDEYPVLCSRELREDASRLAGYCYTIEEFLAGEAAKGNIESQQFTGEKAGILLHGHCQQKAVATTSACISVLSLPENYTVSEIPSGCCGMAGSFGYEKEHYTMSMKIGELVLFPSVRKAGEAEIIAAAGTSCRQQIKDGTGRQALHPVEILYRALRVSDDQGTGSSG